MVVYLEYRKEYVILDGLRERDREEERLKLLFTRNIENKFCILRLFEREREREREGEGGERERERELTCHIGGNNNWIGLAFRDKSANT